MASHLMTPTQYPPPLAGPLHPHGKSIPPLRLSYHACRTVSTIAQRHQCMRSEFVIDVCGTCLLISRLGLPQDALDEFFSILRPSLFNPNPPAFRVLRNESGSALVMPVAQNLRAQERSHSRSPSLGGHPLEESILINAPSDVSAFSGSIAQDDESQASGRMWRLPGILGMYLSDRCAASPFAEAHLPRITCVTHTHTQSFPAAPILRGSYA